MHPSNIWVKKTGTKSWSVLRQDTMLSATVLAEGFTTFKSAMETCKTLRKETTV